MAEIMAAEARRRSGCLLWGWVRRRRVEGCIVFGWIWALWLCCGDDMIWERNRGLKGFYIYTYFKQVFFFWLNSSWRSKKFVLLCSFCSLRVAKFCLVCVREGWGGAGFRLDSCVTSSVTAAHLSSIEEWGPMVMRNFVVQFTGLSARLNEERGHQLRKQMKTLRLIARKDE